MREAVWLVTIMLTFAAPCAEGAILDDVSGVVFVDRGSGFARKLSGAQLVPGDRVRVSEGTAAIDYGGGCKVQVAEGQIIKVVEMAPCPKAISGEMTGETAVPGALFVGGAAAIISSLGETLSSAASPPMALHQHPASP